MQSAFAFSFYAVYSYFVNYTCVVGGLSFNSRSFINTCTLKVKITQARNGSKYRCVVTDDYDLSVTSIEAYLKVVAVPVTEGFKNQIDLSDPNVLVEPVVSEPANEVVIVESDNVSAEETAVIEAEVVETEVVETVVEETASETEIVETVDEQVS